jgi:hypothetical protein
MAMVKERRGGDERRVENIPVEEERRLIQRRQGDPSRRQLMDRRQSNVSVENDRRQGSRRNADIEATENDSDAVPDWMEGVLAEAAQRREEMPAMSPPPVDKVENKHFQRSEEEIAKQARIGDWILIVFVLGCVVGLITLLVTTL